MYPAQVQSRCKPNGILIHQLARYTASGEGRGVLTLNSIKEAGPSNINTNTGKNEEKNGKEDRSLKSSGSKQLGFSRDLSLFIFKDVSGNFSFPLVICSHLFALLLLR